ncbi:STAS-like domain-containing protein [Pedobacter cryophilus]|uniref:DUF4325 domain-containing protein n=1 Tax=Pedobacter cryophilus TaxID=2571271 RepID=A0A4U1C707_9SPHI|nr:DUF4325 domain-containing protein [Pedobacter cryophilus]TKC00167.1 DUF4325 domain-containing protein [Pedobacter cryophilus]
MSQVRINIVDIIGTSNAIIQKFGNQIFEVASSYLNAGSSIVLDFHSISNLTSGFCNASIGQLYTKYPSIASANIVIENIDQSSVWYEKIQDSIVLAQNPEKAVIIDNAILALFD